MHKTDCKFYDFLFAMNLENKSLSPKGFYERGFSAETRDEDRIGQFTEHSYGATKGSRNFIQKHFIAAT